MGVVLWRFAPPALGIDCAPVAATAAIAADAKGVVASLAQLLFGFNCNIVQSDQFSDESLRPSRFFQVCVCVFVCQAAAAVSDTVLTRTRQLHTPARAQAVVVMAPPNHPSKHSRRCLCTCPHPAPCTHNDVSALLTHLATLGAAAH